MLIGAAGQDGGVLKPIGNGTNRYLDLVGLDAETQQPVQYFQFVKQDANRVLLRPGEALAAQQIENALKLPPGTIQLVNTLRH